MRGTDTVVDVETVGRGRHRGHARTEFMEDCGRGLVGRTMRAIDDQVQAAQIKIGREGGFAEFDVAPGGIFEPARAPEARGIDARQAAAQLIIDLALDRSLDLVGQLAAVTAEKFDAVVIVRIVRSRDHHARVETQRAREVGHARRRQRTAKNHIATCGGETGFERGFEHVAGDAGVLADQHLGPMRIGARPCEHAARGSAQMQHEIGRDRRMADLAAYTIGTEVFARHLFPLRILGMWRRMRTRCDKAPAV